MLGILSSFASSCTWAVGTANYSKLSRKYRPYDVNFARALWTLPCFVIAALAAGGIGGFRAFDATNAAWLTVSVLASYAIGDTLFLKSTVALGVPGALAIASGYPILTALIGQAYESQPLRGIQWFGLAVAIAGIVLVILNDPKGTPKEGEEVRAHPLLRKKSVGVALAIGTALCWTMNGYSIAKGGNGISAFVANAFRMAIALPLIATLSFLTDKSRVAWFLDRESRRRYGWVFIVESFFGATFFVYGLTHTSLVVGNTLSALAPVLSVPVAVALKLEKFSWIRTAAVLTVVVGLSLLFR